jgi:hypothetical protein
MNEQSKIADIIILYNYHRTILFLNMTQEPFYFLLSISTYMEHTHVFDIATFASIWLFGSPHNKCLIVLIIILVK